MSRFFGLLGEAEAAELLLRERKREVEIEKERLDEL